MRVYNPHRVPVTVDRGRVVPAGAWADVPRGARVDQALASGRLISEPPKPPKSKPAPTPEKGDT